MKNENENSIIILTKEEIFLVIESLKLWIKIEQETNLNPTIFDEILLKINSYLENKKNKEKYYLKLNLLELLKIHDSLSDSVIYYKGNLKNIKPICENIENIIKKYYKYRLNEVTYPIYKWNELIKSYKNKKE